MSLIGFKVANETVEWDLLREIWIAADASEAYDVGWNFDHLYPIYGEPARVGARVSLGRCVARVDTDIDAGMPFDECGQPRHE